MSGESSFGSLRVTAFPVAIGLAIFFILAQAVLFFSVSFVLRVFSQHYGHYRALDDATEVAYVGVFNWCHALFVILVAAASRKSGFPPGFGVTALKASVLLALPFAAFAWLDAEGARYVCADGGVHRDTHVPMWPWLWVGWVCITYVALPDKLIAWTSGERLTLVAHWKRALLMTPFIAVIWVLGWPFQVRTIDCEREPISYGLFDGGLIAVPLLGLFLFTMSFSMAVLSAAFRRQSK